MNETLKQLPLRPLHEQAGARFGAFAGWSMPLTYPAGVMQEHQHTRAEAGLFDISHMKLVELSGDKAAVLLARACPIDPGTIAMGQSKYTFLLNERAGILDDVIVTRLGEARFLAVVNAGNAEADIAHLGTLAGETGGDIAPLDRVLLALQGPLAAEILAATGLDAGSLSFMHGFEPRPGWFVSRSGYTGEDGFEIAVPVEDGIELAGRLLADPRCRWAGLAARDSLRLEAGLCLHGQDIDTTTTPVEAGLLWAIAKPLRSGGSYIGAAALEAAIADGPSMRRVGLKPQGRQPVRAGAKLFDGEGNEAGRVTSGGFGPSAGHPIAMGYVRADLAAAGTELTAEVRGNRVAIAVHPLPFVPHRYHKG